MAIQVNLTGVVTVKFQVTAGTGNLLDLGQAEDQPQISIRAFMHNVPGDARGGPQGPPIEVQSLGEMAQIRIAMSKWDPTNYDILKKRNAWATAGVNLGTEVGTLMLESKPIRLLLSSTTRPLNFPSCIIRDAFELNMGTKYSTLVVSAEAHAVVGSSHFGSAAEGTLYDAVTTEYT